MHDLKDDIDEIGRNTLVPSFLETVSLATGMGFAAVARVTETRWVTCYAVDKISFGLTPGDELDVETILCHKVRQSDMEIVIDDVSSDPAFCKHHPPAQYNIQSYVSIPIRRNDGTFFGTLCAIDTEPRNVKDENLLAMFRLFAKMIGESLETNDTPQECENAVRDERQLTNLQQEFISILAHDLRNPVSALGAGLRMFERAVQDERTLQIVSLMTASLGRMTNLIENLLDQARQRQTGGIIINRDALEPLEPVIEQIVLEMKAISPDHVIECDIDLPQNVDCDRDRIAQMLSNLLGNAITHGAQGRPIRIVAKTDDGFFQLSVTNEGAMIPPEQIADLFLPFHQRATNAAHNGLGLGLYIASEIAKAHGGTLDVTSDVDRTEFSFRMPLA